MELRLRKRWIIGAVVLVVLVIIGLGFYWNIEPSPLVPPGKDKQPVGAATTTQLINSIETLLNKPGGFLSNDVMPPGVFMDNIPNWEYGALTQLRDFTYVLRNQWSRPQAQSAGDSDLANAFPKLNISRNSWIFPRAETDYEEAADYLKHYRERLEGKTGPGAEFVNRPNNLDIWLQIVSRRLGGLTQELMQVGGVSDSMSRYGGANPVEPRKMLPPGGAPPVSGVPGLGRLVPAAIILSAGDALPGEEPSPQAEPPQQGAQAPSDNHPEAPKNLDHSWLLADNYFYRARGATWALLNLCRGIEIDFHDQLVQKQALNSFKFLEQTLENAQKGLTTPVILAGPYFSFFPNHPLQMASFLSTANATVINIRRMMIAD